MDLQAKTFPKQKIFETKNYTAHLEKKVKMMAVNIVWNSTVFCIHGAEKTIDQLV